ncbi:MAG TPA: TonB-dependent receptor [Steroidobacteraceae bacterium]|nr:TonB-dependent receptor [Steroidobacteraceae bacterium]
MSDGPIRSVSAAIVSILHRLPPAAAAAALAVGIPALVAPLSEAAAADATGAAGQVGPPQPAAAPAPAAPSGAGQQIAQSTSLNEVVVTGTRFKTPNAASPAPITIVGGADLIHQGTAKIEDLMDSLPQTNAGLMDADNGAGVTPLTGTATVDLRGLGSFKTLVLMNGRRINPGDAVQPSPDLHTIPEILLQRVEVETGGASSIYGSDAIAGVVNFVVDTNFVGNKLLLQGSGNYYGNDDTEIQSIDRASGVSPPAGSVFDGGTFNIAGVHGFNFGGNAGHMEVYAGYRHNGGILTSSRDFSACTLTETGPSFRCQFDGTTPAGQFVDAAGNSWTLGPGATLQPFDVTTNGYNPSPITMLRPDTRYEGGTFAQYKFGDHAQAYFEGTFTHDYTTVFYSGPSGTSPPGTSPGNSFAVPCSDPLLSANEAATLCTGNGLAATDVAQLGIGQTTADLGPLEDTFRHTSWRVLAGMKGDITENWTYDASLQYGKVTSHEKVFNDVSLSRVANALDVVSVNGTPTCTSVVDGTDPSCVPYNIWGTGPVTPGSLSYIRQDGTQNGYAKNIVADAQAVGDLGAYGLKSPWATDTFGLAVGAEYREQRISNQPDQAYLTGDLVTMGTIHPTLGTYHVSEVFTELKLPLAKDKPGIYDLNLDVADRYAEYSPQGSANAYSFDGVFAPIRQVRLRGGFNRAIRAPNGHELFLSEWLVQQQTPDPCAGATPTATAAQCALTGVKGSEYGHIPAANTVNVIFGGSPNIKPEISNSYTAGVVLTDFDWAPTLLFSADYWHIYIDKYVGAVAASTSLAGCMTTGAPVFCDLIVRDPQGSLSIGNSPISSGHVLAITTNTGSYEESGIDLAGQYIVRMSPTATLGFTFNGSYLIDNTIAVVPGQPVVDCTALYGAGCTQVGPTSPIPKWRHNLRTTWTVGKVSASLNWRFIGAMSFEGTSVRYGQYLTSNPSFAVDDHVPNYNFFDLDAGYSFTPEVSLHLGVNNLLGKMPPIIGYQANPLLQSGNLLSGVYDSFGREVFAELSATF